MSKQAEKLAQRALRWDVKVDGAPGDQELNEAVVTDRVKTKQNEIKLIRQRLATSLDGHIRRSADLVLEAGDRPMGDTAFAEFRSRLNRATETAEADKLLADLEDGYEARGRDARVTREPRTYAADSPHSYFADIGALVAGEGEVGIFRHQEGAERLNRHAVEVSGEIRARSKEGRAAERILREMTRCDDPDEHRRRAKEAIGLAREQRASDLREQRALLTGGGITASAASGAAAFVSPMFIQVAWAPFRSPHRTFADCCGSRPLPPYGMEAYVPAVSSTTGMGQQTEGAAVAETDPSTALQGGQVANVSGQITLSQQLHDRGYVGDGTFDEQIAKQLGSQLDSQLDVYVLNQVLGGIPAGGVILDNTAPAQATFIPNLYADIAKAREVLTDTAGVRLRPTHIFSTSDLFSYITRQVDSQNRPIVVPQYAAALPQLNGADDGFQGDGETPAWSRFSGLMWPGNVAWFLDDNIPASGADTQIVVSAPDEAVLLLESPEPILTAFPQLGAASLELVLNLRRYVVAVARHASGSATVSGGAYPSSLV